MGMGFPAERTKQSQVPIKLAQPFPTLELRAKFFTDTRLFLNVPRNQRKTFDGISRDLGWDIPGVPETFEKKKCVFKFWPVSDLFLRVLQIYHWTEHCYIASRHFEN